MNKLSQRSRRKYKSTKLSKAFSIVTSSDYSTGNLLPEEFQYKYDVNGQMLDATFAMSPQSWTPSGGASYYDASHPAPTRGRTHYDYDAGGRIKGVYNWWDTWNSGSNSYTSAPIRANECTYELTGSNRGLKTQNKYYNVSSGSWNLQRTESYGYDANLDYLASANYGDGLANATPTWTYDAAGNRVSDSTNAGTWTYDNLNRMTASPGLSYTNDILGNRLTKGTGGSASSYGWDDLNRMTQLVAGGYTNNYVYRADGLRVSKSRYAGSSATNTTKYRYDGQMGIEDVESSYTGGGNTTVGALTRFALGGRGIDAVSRTTSSGTTVSYPLYDAHGNGVGSLAKSGASWTIAGEKTYDAWGGIRSEGASDSKGKYCANLGHKQDDESGLIYMRARHYEVSSGRFVSQDRSHQGKNWFVYCSSNPLNIVDSSGNEGIWLLDLVIMGICGLLLLCEAIVAIPLLVVIIIAVFIFFLIKTIIDAFIDGYEHRRDMMERPWHGEDPQSWALMKIDDAKQSLSGNLPALLFIRNLEAYLWLAIGEDV